MSRRVSRYSNVLRISRFLTVFVAAAAVVVSTIAPATLATASAETSTSTSLASVASDPLQTNIVKTSLAGFNPGNIMSDAVFTDEGTMTESQIQSFLNGKVSRCQSGYVCLKDLKIPTQSMARDSYCAAYAGSSSETAARIIYKVSQACDINPQVLIVMLQKEQGLVTHTWPSDWRFNKAMGQGCPDTAPCNVAYAGFFAQVYGAARQMQVYMEGKYFQWYKAGKTWQIQYHPDRDRCGTSPVYIANKATEALYYYTPYQPNAAALRAGHGLGDSCSSYGNRNFYNYFTDWFGPTSIPVTGAIATEWNRTGGASGQLGHPEMTQAWVAVNGGGYYQRFEKGYIWLKRGSARAYAMGNGPFLENYKSAGAERGSWGWPVSEAACALADGGCKMRFQMGTTYYSPKTESALVPSALVPAYTKLGAETSALGYPRKSAVTASGGKIEQEFANGIGVYSAKTGLQILDGKLADAWRASGGLNSTIGMPSSAPVSVSGNGGGRVLELTAGTIWESAAGGFVMGFGPFRTNYLSAGGPAGSWGWPAGAAKCGLTGGGCLMNFQKGTVGYSPATGSVLMTGAVATEWLRVDPRSVGYPKAAPKSVSANGGGTTQEFTGGTIYSSSAGAFAMGFGPFRTNYLSAGGPAGSWGWPAGGADCGLAQRGCTMPFQNGTVAYVASIGSMLIPAGGVRDEWTKRGGVNGSLGYPKATATVNGTLTSQRFQGGTITFDTATNKVTVN